MICVVFSLSRGRGRGPRSGKVRGPCWPMLHLRARDFAPLTGNVAKRAQGRRLHQSESGDRNQEGFHNHHNHHRGEQEQHERCAAAMRAPLDTQGLAYQCDRQQAEGWAGRIEPTFDVDRHDSQYLEHVVEDMGTDTDRSCVAPAEAFPGRATKATSRCRGVLEWRPSWSASDRL